MIDKGILYSNLNSGLIYERFSAFERNLEKNLPYIRRHGGLQGIMPLLAGKHVIIAGAGPSLEKDLHLLKKYQFRRELVIISTDMALRPLVRSGIVPGFVISCETTPVDFFGGLDTGKMRLLAFTCMSGINVRKWRGEMHFYNWMLHEEPFNALWEKAGRELGFVATASLVTTQAVAIALGCGIQSLLLCGNDMAFLDRFYLRESLVHARHLLGQTRLKPMPALEMEVSRRAREYEIHRDGNGFYTNSQFLAAKLWLEELLEKQTVPVFDCSVPGCSVKSVRKTHIREYFLMFEARKNRKGRQR